MQNTLPWLMIDDIVRRAKNTYIDDFELSQARIAGQKCTKNENSAKKQKKKGIKIKNKKHASFC